MFLGLCFIPKFASESNFDVESLLVLNLLATATSLTWCSLNLFYSNPGLLIVYKLYCIIPFGH